jgi:hypothetical protein
MATYYDYTDADDLKLLPVTMRTAEELQEVSAIAEADAIAYYTEGAPNEDYTLRTVERAATQTGDYEYVYLVGYEEDADDADTGLALALKRAIAEVIRWRLTQWKREMGIASESDDRGRSKTYTLDAHTTNFPPAWNRWLEPFDSREDAWGV